MSQLGTRYRLRFFKKQNNDVIWFRVLGPDLIMPSSAALQKVLGHIGAVAMRLTLLVWSENIWMVSLTVRSCTWTFVSAAPVINILSPEWGRNCMERQNHERVMTHFTVIMANKQIMDLFWLGCFYMCCLKDQSINSPVLMLWTQSIVWLITSQC